MDVHCQLVSPGELLLAGCTWSDSVPWGVAMDVHCQLVSLGEVLLAGCTWSDGVPWGVAAGWMYIVSWFPLGTKGLHTHNNKLEENLKFHGDSIKKLLTYNFMCLWVHCDP